MGSFLCSTAEEHRFSAQNYTIQFDYIRLIGNRICVYEIYVFISMDLLYINKSDICG